MHEMLRDFRTYPKREGGKPKADDYPKCCAESRIGFHFPASSAAQGYRLNEQFDQQR